MIANSPDPTPSANKPQSPVTGVLLALLGFAIYATHDAFVKYLHDYNVFQIIFFAMLFAYVPFSIARIVDNKAISLRPNNPKLVLLRAVSGVCSLSLAFFGFSTLPLVQAYVLIFCTPLIISVLAIVFLGEKIHLIRWFAIFMGLAGVVIVLRPTPDSLQVGHLAALGSAFFGAVSAVTSRKLGNSENTATMIMFPILANILVAGIALGFVYKPMSIIDLGVMFLIGVLGLFGQYFVLSGYRNAPAAFVAPMQYSQIVWAIMFGYFFFGEAIDQWAAIGASITVLSGVVIIFREQAVSKVQAILNSRHTRMVAAPMIRFRKSSSSKNTDS